MRILLNACVPGRLCHDFASAGTAVTATYAGLSLLTNGALLSAMTGVFDVLITTDTNLRYQNVIVGRPIAVVVMRAPMNAIVDLRPPGPEALSALATVAPGSVIEII
jgi:predicted nuclease of predicted toxin-antitoxin system